MKKDNNENKSTVKFTVDELIKAKKFSDNKDVLVAVCDANMTYSVDEAEALIKKYYESEVR